MASMAMLVITRGYFQTCGKPLLENVVCWKVNQKSPNFHNHPRIVLRLRRFTFSGGVHFHPPGPTVRRPVDGRRDQAPVLVPVLAAAVEPHGAMDQCNVVADETLGVAILQRRWKYGEIWHETPKCLLHLIAG